MSTREKSSDFLPQGWLLRGTLVLDSLHDRNPPSNAANRDRLRCGENQDLSWGCTSKGTLPRCQWPHLYSCWALHQQDQDCTGCGEVPKHQLTMALSCILCLSSVLFGLVLDIQEDSGLWKCVVSCLGCCLTSVYYWRAICRHHDENWGGFCCFCLKGESVQCSNKGSQCCLFHTHQTSGFFPNSN